MKKTIFSIVVSVVLLFIGCQENSITDPVPTDPLNKTQNQGTTTTSGYFPLEGILISPTNVFNSYFSIEGGINYVHEKVFLDPIPPAPQYYISLKFTVEAVLSDPVSTGHNSWNISSESEDYVYVSEEGMLVFEKTFPVQGREDGLALVCRFLVTADGVGLSDKWLVVGYDIQLNKGTTNGDAVNYPPVKLDVWE